MSVRALNIEDLTVHDFTDAENAASYTGDDPKLVAKWLEKNTTGRWSYWRYAEPGQRFPTAPFPVICRETGKRFLNGHELAVAGFNPATVARAAVHLLYRAGCKLDGKKYKFYHQPLPIAFPN